jgi:hypothetical protein
MSPFTQLELFSNGVRSMKVNFQHLTWPAQSLELSITELLRPVLETRVGNRFPPPATLKQLEDILQEELYKIQLETARNLYKTIPRRIAAVLQEKVVWHRLSKEMCTVSVVFPLFCPTPVCLVG